MSKMSMGSLSSVKSGRRKSKTKKTKIVQKDPFEDPNKEIRNFCNLCTLMPKKKPLFNPTGLPFDVSTDTASCQVHSCYITVKHIEVTIDPPVVEVYSIEPNTSKHRMRMRRNKKYLYDKTPSEIEFENETNRRIKLEMRAERIRWEQMMGFGPYSNLISVSDKLLKTVGPHWFQELSYTQMLYIDILESTISADVEEGVVTRTQRALAGLGILPRPSSKHVDKAISKCYLNPILFITYLYKYTTNWDDKKKSPEKHYSVNDRLLLSGLAHLALRRTIKDLEERLPLPIVIPTEKSIIHKESELVGVYKMKKRKLFTKPSPYMDLQPYFQHALHEEKEEAKKEKLRRKMEAESIALATIMRQNQLTPKSKEKLMYAAVLEPPSLPVKVSVTKRNSLQTQESYMYNTNLEGDTIEISSEKSVHFSGKTDPVSDQNNEARSYSKMKTSLTYYGDEWHKRDFILKIGDDEDFEDEEIEINSDAADDSRKRVSIVSENEETSVDAILDTLEDLTNLSKEEIKNSLQEETNKSEICTCLKSLRAQKPIKPKRLSPIIELEISPSGELPFPIPTKPSLAAVIGGYWAGRNVETDPEDDNEPASKATNRDDELKETLAEMGRRGNILASLPRIERHPAIIQWLKFRHGYKLTKEIKYKLMQKSLNRWKMMEDHPRVIRVPRPKFSHHLNWTHKKWLLKKVDGIYSKYHADVRQAHVHDTREYWPTMYMYDFDCPEFKNVYYAYLPGKEEDIAPMHLIL